MFEDQHTFFCKSEWITKNILTKNFFSSRIRNSFLTCVIVSMCMWCVCGVRVVCGVCLMCFLKHFIFQFCVEFFFGISWIHIPNGSKKICFDLVRSRFDLHFHRISGSLEIFTDIHGYSEIFKLSGRIVRIAPGCAWICLDHISVGYV